MREGDGIARSFRSDGVREDAMSSESLRTSASMPREHRKRTNNRTYASGEPLPAGYRGTWRAVPGASPESAPENAWKIWLFRNTTGPSRKPTPYMPAYSRGWLCGLHRGCRCGCVHLPGQLLPQVHLDLLDPEQPPSPCSWRRRSFFSCRRSISLSAFRFTW